MAKKNSRTIGKWCQWAREGVPGWWVEIYISFEVVYLFLMLFNDKKKIVCINNDNNNENFAFSHNNYHNIFFNP